MITARELAWASSMEPPASAAAIVAPLGSFYDLDVEPVLLVEAGLRRVDDGGRRVDRSGADANDVALGYGCDRCDGSDKQRQRKER